MTDRFESLLDRLEELMAHVETLDDDVRAAVFELLDGVDTLHRLALHRLVDELSPDDVARARAVDPVVEWLLDAYGVGVDERTAAERALDTVRPYVDSHGGRVELLDVRDGRVRLRMGGSCSGCSASAVTLSEGVEEALRRGLPGFVALEVEEEEGAEPHPPPGETLVPLGPTRR